MGDHLAGAVRKFIAGLDRACRWCGKPLVEVDNPMRRELRHRRGEEALCPGPPTTEAGETPTLTVNRLTATVPVAHGACPECGKPASYNFGTPYVLLHDDEADHAACPEVATAREAAERAAKLFDDSVISMFSTVPIPPPAPVDDTRPLKDKIEDMIERFGPFEQPEPPHGLSSWVWTNPPEPPPADRWLDTGDVRTGVFNTAIESMAVGMAGKFDQWIAALPPGHRLCMHDEVKLSTDDFALDRDTVTFRLSQRGHHLEPGETCDYHGTRVEYGPRS